MSRAAATTRSSPRCSSSSPTIGVRPENLVFVSGIGCAARFPYYMNTYGLHSIHGRAPAVATGVALGAPRPRRVGHRRRRRHALDRRQPPDPRAAPQREPEDHHVQQPDLRAHQGPVLADERGGQDHEVVAVRLARHPVQPGVGRAGRRGHVRRPHPRHGPPGHARGVPAGPRAPGQRVRRDLPELQRLQRRRVRGDHGQGSARRHAHPAACTASPSASAPTTSAASCSTRSASARSSRSPTWARTRCSSTTSTATTRRWRSRCRGCRRPADDADTLGVFRVDSTPDLRGRGAAPARERGRSVRVPATSASCIGTGATWDVN